MTKQGFTYLLVLLAGLAGGTGLGYLLTQSRLQEAEASLEKLNAQIEEQTEQSQKELQEVEAEMSRLESALVRARNDVMRKNTELQRAQTQLNRMKSVLDQTLQGQGSSSQASSAERTAVSEQREETRSVSAGTAGTREYVIQEGDSLWRIAATELGDGVRWREIDELNPNIDQNSTLKVGTTIQIPAE